jgi:DnaJ like chaperone protein
LGWWGKIVGGAFGFMLGGPLGAVLGAALGHSFDKGLSSLPDGGAAWQAGDRERIQTAFFTATFSVMGHLAKVDGRVSRDEIALAEAVMAEMDLDAQLRRTAVRLFNEGKSRQFPLDEVLEQFRAECRGRSTLLRMFIEILLQAAYADGRLEAAEDRLLRHVCERLGVSEFEYRRLQRMAEAERHFAGAGAGPSEGHGGRGAPTLADAYAVLGVGRDASDQEVKKAYRRLLSQHHPDKLVSKGLPEEMMKMAAHKTHEIKQAYERIKAERKF